MNIFYKDLENGVAFNYQDNKFTLYDSNENIIVQTRESWISSKIDIKKLSYRFNYKFFIGEDKKIYVLIEDSGLRMLSVVDVKYKKNCLLTNADDKLSRLWFPLSYQERYQNILNQIGI